MKRLLLLLVLAASAPAAAQQNLLFKSETQTLSASAPTLDSDGVAVDSAHGYLVVVSANSGQTVTGGSMLCYAQVCVQADNAGKCSTKRWNRCPSYLDFTPGTSQRDPPSGDFEVLAGVFRIAYRTSSITVSGGTTVVVTYTVRNRK